MSARFFKINFLILWLTSFQAQALFDGQLVIGYAGLKYVDDGSAATANKFKDTSLQAMTIAISAHIHASEPNVIAVGIGPYLITGPGMRYTSDAGGTPVSYASSQLMIGGEIYGKILAGVVVLPYIKFGYGADRVSAQVNIGNASTETRLVRSGYRILVRVEYVIAPGIGVILEGGAVESSFSVSGSNISGEKAKGGGYMLNTGISVSF